MLLAAAFIPLWFVVTVPASQLLSVYGVFVSDLLGRSFLITLGIPFIFFSVCAAAPVAWLLKRRFSFAKGFAVSFLACLLGFWSQYASFRSLESKREMTASAVIDCPTFSYAGFTKIVHGLLGISDALQIDVDREFCTLTANMKTGVSASRPDPASVSRWRDFKRNLYEGNRPHYRRNFPLAAGLAVQGYANGLGQGDGKQIDPRYDVDQFALGLELVSDILDLFESHNVRISKLPEERSIFGRVVRMAYRYEDDLISNALGTAIGSQFERYRSVLPDRLVELEKAKVISPETAHQFRDRISVLDRRIEALLKRELKVDV